MDVKVIVSVYEERPRRRRPISHGASTATSAPRQAGRGYSRRALLLAYAQQLRRRRRQQQNGPPLLEWSEWKAGRVASGDLAVRELANLNDLFAICFFSTRMFVHGIHLCGGVADDDEGRREEKLVFEAAVLRPALGQDVSSGSQED
ncbi:hypothetical protein HU200_045376 [Digitaria exilis]|uniref:Uncharacterized protein n=1 Tax=Digitaria exilis TaxID=1010633 RepID=A0A835B108_9POAL|nr:hypothetical protein HU200_045376 [Digitaria exilis]